MRFVHTKKILNCWNASNNFWNNSTLDFIMIDQISVTILRWLLPLQAPYHGKRVQSCCEVQYASLVKNHTSHFTHVTIYILTDTKMDKMTPTSFLRTAFHNIKQSWNCCILISLPSVFVMFCKTVMG